MISLATRAKLSISAKGRIRSAATREKMSASATGKIFSLAHRKNISAAAKSRTFSPAHRKNISAALIGSVPWNKGLKLTASQRGQKKPRTPEHCAAISAAKKGQNTGPRIERAMKSCLTCGTSITVTVTKPKKFCSKACRVAARARRPEKGPRPPVVKEPRPKIPHERKPMSAEYRARLSAAKLGVKRAPFSDATRAKMRASAALRRAREREVGMET
jgi:hypothetical protein